MIFRVPGWVARPALVCLFVFLFAGPLLAGPAGTNQTPALVKIDLADPAVVTGTFYEIGSHRTKILFQYRRDARRDGNLIHVDQTFTVPAGLVACRETILYRNDQLAFYVMRDLRAGSQGSILIAPDPKKPKWDRLEMEYLKNQADPAHVHKSSEPLQPNTLISDTIYPFILAHWDELLQGNSIKFRFVSLDPAGTFNFRLLKDSEGAWQGQSVVGIKMEPANFIIAHWIRPIFFTIETAAPHRIFSYTGRTTPRVYLDGAWKFVDAEAVFDWP